VEAAPLRAARRPRAFVRVEGPDAASYLERMLSNEVEPLAPGEACEALLLTPKARVVATVTVWRRGADDFLLLTEPEAGERLRSELVRYRFAARAAIELEEHASTLVLGEEAPPGAIANRDYGLPAYELLDAAAPASAGPIGDDELEALRIRALTPRLGVDVDDRVLPAEAGLDERAISFGKGCYPGQEPVARLHYRGHANRGLRALAVPGGELPPRDAPLVLDGKEVGRVTSAARDGDGVVVLAFVRREVPAEAELALGERPARQLRPAPRAGPLDWAPSRP
jgi:tRNA-modifying protein YgfZ